MDTIEDYLWDFTNWLYDWYLWAFYDLLIGWAFDDILYGMYYAMFYVSQGFGDLNDWIDDVIDDLDYVWDWIDYLDDTADAILVTIAGFLTWTGIKAQIDLAYDILAHTWSDIEALIPSWTDLVPEGFPASLTDLTTLISTTVSGAYDILAHTWSDIEALIPSWTDLVPEGFPASLTDLAGLISSTILGAFTSIDTWLDDQKIKVLGWVTDMFPYDITDAQALLTWIGIEAGDVITTILDTPADMFAWIKGEIDLAYDILAHTWSDIEALIPSWTDLVPTGFPASLTDLTALISSTILGAFTSIDKWLDDQMDKVLGWVVDSFEPILDKVFKEKET